MTGRVTIDNESGERPRSSSSSPTCRPGQGSPSTRLAHNTLFAVSVVILVMLGLRALRRKHADNGPAIPDYGTCGSMIAGTELSATGDEVVRIQATSEDGHPSHLTSGGLGQAGMRWTTPSSCSQRPRQSCAVSRDAPCVQSRGAAVRGFNADPGGLLLLSTDTSCQHRIGQVRFHGVPEFGSNRGTAGKARAFRRHLCPTARHRRIA